MTTSPMYGPRVPPHSRPVDGLAVASLVCSLLLLAPLALPLGIIALVRTARTGHRGRGLAIAGISVSGVVLALAVSLLTGLLHFRVWTTEGPGSPTEVAGAPTAGDGVRVHIDALQERDCFSPGDEPTQDGEQLDDFSAMRIPCGEAHRGEVFALFHLPDKATYPGAEWIKRYAVEECTHRLFDYTPDPAAYGGLRTFFYFPERERWERGDRTVRCWAGLPQGELEQSVHQDADAMDPAQRAYLDAIRPLQQTQANMPIKGPKSDLSGARRWAKAMAAAQSKTARLLTEAELPADVRESAQTHADELRRGVPHWDTAANAATANDYLTAMRRAAVDPVRGVELERSLRTGLGLPVPDGATAPGSPGRAVA
ncbi:DUF4190 domain-containing protein [Streptomyces indicus]|uniref:Septum formation n=1 Tax=Streptomyces indicus TaxID=417292 RepID=A0A1G9GPB2_9ACTN|nr:DUF4190 domain-containing protein [Streptomyces indicus]SDL02497.1 Septum formation [Streptomyces indicus]